MNKVTDNLYIGGVHDLRILQPLRDAGITTVLKLYQDKEDYPVIPPDLPFWDKPVVDGAGWDSKWIGDTIAQIQEAILRGEKVLVMCAAGRSRSATVVLAYLSIYGNMSLAQAWKHLKQCRPVVDPHIELVVALYRFLGCQYLSNMLGE